MAFQVVDVFAGPGGLNEGFASFTHEGTRPFSIASSIEMDPRACDTLRLRAALRAIQSEPMALPASYLRAAKMQNPIRHLEDHPVFARALDKARQHVHEFELATSTRAESDSFISSAVKCEDPWILVGGPPCQLYSLVGRARASKLDYFEDDVRHVLYKEYLHILHRHRPAVFVMENVKGMLSAAHRGSRVFEMIREDITSAGYELRSLTVPGTDLEPTDFIIRSERHGIPQARHRVILLGVRADIADHASGVLEQQPRITVDDAIGGMPAIRSRLSPVSRDDAARWTEARNQGLKEAGLDAPPPTSPVSHGARFVRGDVWGVEPGSAFGRFVPRPAVGGYLLHEARSHMESDISRYAYYAQNRRDGRKVHINDLPLSLRPNHRNVGTASTPFTDRFNVQAAGGPSTTVVSHISKDGHYFIHPDPLQARSLTVREAARLQTFPDDYVFIGNRTQQYHQVGNAVPPLLARQIAEIVHDIVR